MVAPRSIFLILALGALAEASKKKSSHIKGPPATAEAAAPAAPAAQIGPPAALPAAGNSINIATPISIPPSHGGGFSPGGVGAPVYHAPVYHPPPPHYPPHYPPQYPPHHPPNYPPHYPPNYPAQPAAAPIVHVQPAPVHVAHRVRAVDEHAAAKGPGPGRHRRREMMETVERKE
ncbi:hypothetical protein ACHAQA_004689 [Verticillium albo-atrum]